MRIITLTIVFLSLVLVSSQGTARPSHRSSSLKHRIALLEAQVEKLTTALEETQQVDDDDGSVQGGTPWFVDADSDGFGNPALSSAAGRSPSARRL